MGLPISFYGFLREVNSRFIPAMNGVYCVYACTNNWWDNTVSIRKLIYIGESSDVRKRIQGHERKADWRRHLLFGEELCYNVAFVHPYVRLQVEAALIHYHCPPENTEYVYAFPFEQISLTLSGRFAFLSPDFTVFREPYSPLLSALWGYQGRDSYGIRWY